MTLENCLSVSCEALDDAKFKAKLYEGRAVELAKELEKAEHDRNRYKNRLEASDALLRRAKAVIPFEYEDEIEVKTAIIRHLNDAV